MCLCFYLDPVPSQWWRFSGCWGYSGPWGPSTEPRDSRYETLKRFLVLQTSLFLPDSTFIRYISIFAVFVACGPVCVCSCEDHWKYCTGHHVTGFLVCLHWSPTFQSEMSGKYSDLLLLSTLYCNVNYLCLPSFLWRQSLLLPSQGKFYACTDSDKMTEETCK